MSKHQNLLDWYIRRLEEVDNYDFAADMRLLDETISESSDRSMKETFSYEQLETFLDELLSLTNYIDLFGPSTTLPDGSRFQLMAYQDGSFIPSGEQPL